jgi:hypothetical protein
MKDVYEILRQKELEVSRLHKEVEALRVAAPLLTDVEGEDYDEPSLASTSAMDATPQPDQSGWQDRGKKSWP